MSDKGLIPLESIPDELFVNREPELEFFWEWAQAIPPLITPHSFAIIGRRRTGKTAILEKIFNRLFHEQNEVIPIFISFTKFLHREEPITSYEFAREYFSGYVRSYFAFRHQEPKLISEDHNFQDLHEFAQQVNDEYILDLFRRYNRTEKATIPYDLVQWVINFPKGTSRTRDMPVAILIDEFQVLTNVYDPVQKIHRDLTNSFQRASESRWAPLLVSGSAVSMFVSDALGGMLQGRFGHYYLPSIPMGDTHTLVFRYGDQLGIEVTDELAEAVWQYTGGNPHSIRSLMTSQCPERSKYPDTAALKKVVEYELSHSNGYLARHYSKEFEKYNEDLNHGTTTRRVMLWVTQFPDQKVDATMASEALGIEHQVARESLEKLRWADVVEKDGISSYKGPNDPMLRRYIEYQHYIEVDKLGEEKLSEDWTKEYERIMGQLSRTKGELGEMYVRMVMGRFNDMKIAGAYLNQTAPLLLPHFDTIERRGGTIASGIPIEIDIIGEWKPSKKSKKLGVWMVEVKYTQRRVGIKLIQNFIDRCATFQEKANYAQVQRWYFSKSGFTKEAIKLLEKAGILYCDWQEFRTLAKLYGCLGLPTKPT